MTVWVTGCRGMLGTTLCQQLQKQQIPYVGTGIEVDIASPKAVEQHLAAHPTITHIINCAAYTQVDKAEQEEQVAHHTNAIGPETLAVAAARQGIKILHFSTDYVFDGTSTVPYKEESPCNPISAYACTKHAGEQKLLRLLPNACIIRTSWLFGLHGKNFVSTMIQLMEQKEQLRIVNDQIGRPTSCDDLAAAAIRMIDQQGIFHFANSGAITWYQFANEIATQWKALGNPLMIKKIDPIPTTDYPTPAKRPAYSVFDTTKIERILNYTPRSWQNALIDHLQQLHHQRLS